MASATCYDGNNGGCSHLCVDSVCSCPLCWTLGEDGKTCKFEAGKAQVTCSTTGVEVTVASCAFPGVDPSLITMKDGACSAVHDQETETYKISSGFDECGSEFSFAEEKLTLSNTLKIGKSIVGGRTVSRKYEIDFGCNYNNLAYAYGAIKANNLKYTDITFDIDDAQPTDLSFNFDLNFFESDLFVTDADLSNRVYQPGNPLFGKITPETALSESLTFSVTKCTVEDTAISDSADILDSCPVDAVDFKFKPSQSDRTSVQFSFTGFAFPGSDDRTTLHVNCEVNICPNDSTECLKLCSPTSPQLDDPVSFFYPL